MGGWFTKTVHINQSPFLFFFLWADKMHSKISPYASAAIWETRSSADIAIFLVIKLWLISAGHNGRDILTYNEIKKKNDLVALNGQILRRNYRTCLQLFLLAKYLIWVPYLSRNELICKSHMLSYCSWYQVYWSYIAQQLLYRSTIPLKLMFIIMCYTIDGTFSDKWN